MQHLFTTPQTLHKEQKLHINTIAGYWSTFRSVLHTAYRDHKILENPNGYLEKIQPYGNGGMYITVRMQKTKQLVNNPVSEEALELIGFYDKDENRQPTDKVFPGLKNSMFQASLKNWIKAAGITKHISFHGSRHTFGSLQADAGTSIYVIQRILGHKNVETTQIYADMSDETKRQSVDRITLKPKVQPLSVVKPTGTE